MLSAEVGSDGSIAYRFLEKAPGAAGKGLPINPIDYSGFTHKLNPTHPESWQSRYAASDAYVNGLYFHQWCGANEDGSLPASMPYDPDKFDTKEQAFAARITIQNWFEFMADVSSPYR